GDISGEVENLEKVFDALDYETGPIDGYLDEGTVSTIKKFQTDHKLDVTGVVSGDTASAMIEDLRSLIKENDTQYEKGLDYLKK
ncbi:MAG: peptidoglycan-binding domain-containing protein, partial [Carnobacterium sp.]